MIHKINELISIYFTDEGFGRSNSVLIDDNVRVMIDSGAGKITQQARPEGVDLLVNSHCHIDHVWDNDLFLNAHIPGASNDLCYLPGKGYDNKAP
ncbi:MAG TPA: MBL fold metallo-hydrolase [Spirochaetota bacterium]|nr:MBL fold metallo-hydrolase [Spirochaetota bacterium]HQO39219.1 MBL fold metallo-hydrolase [Spirochaetota bacterium]